MDVEQDHYQNIFEIMEAMPKDPDDLFLRSLPWRRAYLNYWVNV
jgi:hypothetical protein